MKILKGGLGSLKHRNSSLAINKTPATRSADAALPHNCRSATFMNSARALCALLNMLPGGLSEYRGMVIASKNMVEHPKIAKYGFHFAQRKETTRFLGQAI
jgi:hypothetical protein